MSSTPYLDKLIKTLDTTKELVRLHEQKIIIASLEPFDKVAYENIEIKISCLKSEGEINTLKRVILEKEDYFQNYYTIIYVTHLDFEAKKFSISLFKKFLLI